MEITNTVSQTNSQSVPQINQQKKVTNTFSDIFIAYQEKQASCRGR